MGGMPLLMLQLSPRRISEVPADDRCGHCRLIGQQEQQRADGILGLSDANRCAPTGIVGAGIGSAILRRVDHSRCHEIEPHAMARNLLGRAFGECDQRRFAGGISRRPGPALVCQPRCERNDASGPPLDHAGDHRLIAPDHAVEIDPQDAIPSRRLHLMNGQAGLNRRRADEAIDLAEMALDLTQHLEHRGPIGHIEASRRKSRNAR
jgi:hypothetical protein